MKGTRAEPSTNSSPKRVFGAAFVVALILSASSAAAAEAASENYCGIPPNPMYYNPGGECNGPRHTITQNTVQNYYGVQNYVCARANDTGNHPYASPVCSPGQATHLYGAGNLLYPVSRNPNGDPGTGGQSIGQHQFGTEYY